MTTPGADSFRAGPTKNGSKESDLAVRQRSRQWPVFARLRRLSDVSSRRKAAIAGREEWTSQIGRRARLPRVGFEVHGQIGTFPGGCGFCHNFGTRGGGQPHWCRRKGLERPAFGSTRILRS